MIKEKLLKPMLSILLALTTAFSCISASLVVSAADEYEAFLYQLGYYESRNTYNIENSFGYLGRWQIGMESLRDIGLVSGNTWTPLANSLGVYSKKDFLNTPSAQDYAIRLYDKKLWSYIQYFGDDKYIGTEFQGIEVTLSGMVAAAHLVGAGGIHRMFMTGSVQHDALGNSCLFYLKNLAGYDISGFLGTSLSKYLNQAIKSKSKIKKIQAALAQDSSKINLFGNTSECNYFIGTDFSQELNKKNFSSRNLKTYSISIDKKIRHSGYNSIKIVGKDIGKINNDVEFNTDTNGNVRNDDCIGDYKKMTLSFYARSTEDNVKLYWRWGYAKNSFEPITISKSWKKYSITVTKERTNGSKLYLYFDKKATVNLAELMLVDGEVTPTLFRCETSKCIKTIKAAYLSSYGNLPSPKRDGYVFDGWYTSKSGGKKVDSSTPAYDRSLNLYAHWTKIPNYVPENAIEFNGHYYTAFTDDLSWDDAKKACEKMGGHLATISSAAENDAVVNLCKSTSKGIYWLGAYSDGKGGWKWVTKEKFDFNSWDKNQPSKSGEKYAQIYAENYENNDHIGKWNDSNSFKGDISWFSVKNVGYICEFEPEKYVTSSVTTNGTSTYYVFDKQISWYNANYFCEINGGSLLTITSEKENEVISSLIKRGKSGAYWLGTQNMLNDGEYLWTTGEDFDYSNWSKGNPSNDNATKGTEHFVQLSKKSLQWNDICNLGYDKYVNGFIMERDTSLPTISSIKVVEAPQTLCYNVGDTVDISGINVVATYSDGSQKRISYGISIEPTALEKEGLQKIKVIYRGLETSFDVYVLKNLDSVRVSNCEFKSEKKSVKIGKSGKKNKLIITPTDAECQLVYYSSSNEKIATVDKDGVVTGISKGEVTIKARSYDGQLEAEYTLKVKRTFFQWMGYYIFFGWVKKGDSV